MDGRTDLFALGVVLYEVLAGERLYGGAPDTSDGDHGGAGADEGQRERKGAGQAAVAYNPGEQPRRHP